MKAMWCQLTRTHRIRHAEPLWRSDDRLASTFTDCQMLSICTVNEAYDAPLWVKMHGDDGGVDGSRLAVSGNSVGGIMAAAVTLMAHGGGGVNVDHQQLLWPALGHRPQHRLLL
jgi:alpha/beta hydrolase fold